MRTLPNRWPASAPRDDYVAECSTCGAPFLRSKLRRNKDGWLLCSRDWERGPAELNAANAAGAARSNPVRPGDGGSYHNDAPYSPAAPATYTFPTAGLVYEWVPTLAAMTISGGGDVTAWAASTGGNSWSLLQGDSAFVASSSHFNGQPTVLMQSAGSGSVFSAAPGSASYSFMLDSDESTWVFVVRAGDPAVAPNLQVQVRTATAAALTLNLRVSTGATRLAVTIPTLFSVDHRWHGPYGDGATVHVLRRRGLTFDLFRNGIPLGEATPKAALLAGSPASLRMQLGGSGFGDVEIARISLFSRALTNNEVQQVQFFCEDEYGVIV